MDGHFIKNWLDSLMVLWSFVGAFCPKFSAPHSGKTMHWMLTRFGGAIIVWTSSITTPSLVVVGLRMPPGGGLKSLMVFYFCLLVTLSNDKVCECHFAMKALVSPS